MPHARTCLFAAGILATFLIARPVAAEITVVETDDEVRIDTSALSATIRKKGYVSGVSRQTFVDKKTGAKDLGYGLDIADWIMEPGADDAYRDRLDPELIYRYGNEYHGNTPKRAIEGPQICTQAKELTPSIVRGPDFVAVKQTFRYRTAAPGKATGSLWTQWLVFPEDTRYFVSMQQIDAVNDSEAMFLRIDMPGHIAHKRGDTFEEIFLSYFGRISSGEFLTNFAPDQRFNYTRGKNPVPERMIRAYRIRDPETKKTGPWLAGMTLAPDVVSEAWCHQRGYVCLIEEFGGRPIRAGESFRAAFIVGYFDSLDDMHAVYDAHRGATRLTVTPEAWKLSAD